MSPPANKRHSLRAVGDDAPVSVTMREIAKIGGVASRRWEREIAHMPPRDLIALVYAEGLYHGAMIGLKMPKNEMQK